MTRKDSEHGLRGGYHLTALKVDLSTGAVERIPISERFALEHIGGPGFGAALLAEHTREGTEALGPENVLAFAPGPLTGLPLPGASRCHVMALSPQTGTIGGGNIGGDLGPAIRRAAFDAVIIVGRAPIPSYLDITDSEVRIMPAAHLLGLSAQAAGRRLHEACDVGGGLIAVAAIGPAGEELDPSAIVSSGGHHCAGGMGAVMGSKNLKAIAVSGDATLPVADPERLAAVAERLSGRSLLLPCPADCAAGCVFKRPAPALGVGFVKPAVAANELGVDMEVTAPRRKRATPEMMLLDLLGLCHQPWLEMEGGIELAVECYRAVTGVKQTSEGMLDAARSLQQLTDR